MQTYANFRALKTEGKRVVENLWIMDTLRYLRVDRRMVCFISFEATSAFIGGTSFAEMLDGLSALAFMVWSRTIDKISTAKTTRLVLFFILTGFRADSVTTAGKPLTQNRNFYFKIKAFS